MPYISQPHIPVADLAPQEATPSEARAFLVERNWSQVGTDPRNGEALFRHSRLNSSTYYRWYEAVAMEAIGLMRIGHD